MLANWFERIPQDRTRTCWRDNTFQLPGKHLQNPQKKKLSAVTLTQLSWYKTVGWMDELQAFRLIIDLRIRQGNHCITINKHQLYMKSCFRWRQWPSAATVSAWLLCFHRCCTGQYRKPSSLKVWDTTTTTSLTTFVQKQKKRWISYINMKVTRPLSHLKHEKEGKGEKASNCGIGLCILLQFECCCL